MKKSLSDITLIAYSSNDVAENIQGLLKCTEYFDFGAVKILSHKQPDYLPEGITYERARGIKDINDFNEYMFLNLGDHVQTSHCLYVQHHAYIINPEIWTNDFLEYSYIGAPWPIVENAYIANNGERARQGNGGFSLRSKILLDLPKKMGWELREEQGWKNEDGNICCYYRKEMLENGIKYAPLDIACKFSYENTIPENVGIKPFGFHRNMPPW